MQNINTPFAFLTNSVWDFKNLNGNASVADWGVGALHYRFCLGGFMQTKLPNGLDVGGSPEMKTLNTGEKSLYEFGIKIQMVNPHEDWMRDRDSRVSPTFSLIRVTGLGHESSS